MPLVNLDRQKELEGRVAKRLASKKEGATAEELRALKKKMRRAQRKRRRLTVRAERSAVKPKAEPAES